MSSPRRNPNSTQLSFECDYVAPLKCSLNRFSRTTQPQTAATANRRAQESATLSPFIRRRGGRKAHHNATTRGFPTPPRPFNPWSLREKRKQPRTHHLRREPRGSLRPLRFARALDLRSARLPSDLRSAAHQPDGSRIAYPARECEPEGLATTGANAAGP